MDPNRLIPGSVPGGILLVAGSCIGAGMLALPIMTGLAGFFPSLFALFIAWAFMTFTALLLVEICGWFYGQINLLSMAKESLGETGRTIGWITYLFLFYALLIAYISASGGIFSAILADLFDLSIPAWGASLFFTLLFGVIVYLGTRPVDLFNRVLMFGLIVAYLGMMSLGISRIHPKLFLHFAPGYTFVGLPVLVVSFGFQNMIPSLTAYMKGDLKRVRLTILAGSLLALAVYVFWTALVLGTVPLEGPHGILDSYQNGEEGASALHAALGNNKISGFATAFAFFAVITSFLAQGLSLTHFIADGLKTVPTRKNTWWLTTLALLPPLIFALSYPEVFFKALGFAGGICAMILFGILPVAMAWIGRYKKGITSSYHVKGGKPALIGALAFALLVIGCEMAHIFL
jgi:tyrosine-specific transport protein